MFGRRRGFRHLADELVAVRAEHADLRRRLEAFEMIAAAAGAAATPEPAQPAPPALVAAARESRSDHHPVRLDVAGSEVIAVVGSSGDPHAWWTAIWRLTAPEGQGPT